MDCCRQHVQGWKMTISVVAYMDCCRQHVQVWKIDDLRCCLQPLVVSNTQGCKMHNSELAPRSPHARACRQGPSPLTAMSFATRTAQHSTAAPSRADQSSEDMSVSACGQIFQSKGLVSIDRSEVAALLSTTPRPKPRSSTNDLAPPRRWDGYLLGARVAVGSLVKSPVAVALSTAAAEGGRAARIVASRCGGAYSIVTFSARILT